VPFIMKFMLDNWFVLLNRCVRNFRSLSRTASCKEEQASSQNVLIIIFTAGLTKGHAILRANHAGNSGVGRAALIKGNSADSTVS
jgi:hypothetical protein